MTTHKSSLQTLVGLATKEVSHAAEKLSEANRMFQDSQNKLAMLVGYRMDYTGQLSTTAKTGVSIEEYHNFQNFLKRLDEAILGQQEIVESNRQKVDIQRKCWQECERRKLSYGVLVTNSQKKAHSLELKKDQKMMDEHAMRMFKPNLR
jgi:flagellar FliJ protein